MSKILIAIDPGAKGAFAVFRRAEITTVPFTGDSDFLESMLSIKLDSQRCGDEVVCWLERVGGYVGSGQPGSAMFKFGDNFGFIRGVVMALGFELRLVSPQTWQKGLPSTPKLADRAAAKRAHKRALKERAAQLYPGRKITLANADALLILDYAFAHTPGF